MKYSKDKIVALHESGKKLKYLFFWGHERSRNGEVTSSCFSQWYASPFTVDNIVYPTAEHWMMACKARLFEDSESCVKILKAKSPGEAKSIGRRVIGFDQSLWDEQRFDIVVKGGFHKFTQNLSLKKYLINTKSRVLVEASPVDSIWGIGLNSEHEFASIPTKWRGSNLLGFALMKVRDMISDL
ncbi:NADAR family protein [Reichenbachiella sp.]|uniref:NADAR family protein n=1 Tax=Reichenbachiella sp. TaxID=2184521 RepID=UPI003BAE8C1F